MAYFNLGNTYQELQNYNLAIKCFKDALRLDTEHADAMYNLAVAYQDRAGLNPAQRNDDLRNALECYERAARLAPTMEDARTGAKAVRVMLRGA
jgi:tetratricopeptide (TPR) repeat protein